MTLTEFLLARITEDEAAARRAGNVKAYRDDVRRSWLERPSGERVVLPQFPTPMEADWLDHALRHLPGRTLAACAAKRAIVDLHNPCDDWSYGDPSTCPELRALAAEYADDPDCHEEWKP